MGILVAVGVSAVPAGASPAAALIERVGTALTGASVLLAVALVLVVALVTERRPSFTLRRSAAQRVAEGQAAGAVVDASA
jgi:hypothetical protein